MVKVIVDAMGGDYAPLEIVKGCVDAACDFDIEITLVGQEDKVKAELDKYQYDKNKIKIVHADEVIGGCDEPTSAIRNKKNSSLCVALSMLAEEKGDVCVSAGNTGALITGATLIVKRLKGVRRVALAPLMPSSSGAFILLDAGANVECTSAFLKQFAVMGSIYMEKVMNVTNPRVGLVNIGEEENKGTALAVETNAELKKLDLNYIGNIEAREIPQGGADVVVCDGFTGNVILKFMEGMGVVFYKMLKDVFYKNIISKLAALFVKSGIKSLKKTMDYTEYGGAPILGASKPVIKAHGNSNAKAFYHAVKQAVMLVENGVIDEIKKNIEKFEVK